MTPQQRQKIKIKERIKKSNEDELNGLPPDPWVVEYRRKNNEMKAKWKALKPKVIFTPKPNSGSFKKGMIPKNRLSPEEKIESEIKRKEREKKWREANKDRMNAIRRERLKNDPHFRAACN